jgi:hypothetical protein
MIKTPPVAPTDSKKSVDGHLSSRAGLQEQFVEWFVFLQKSCRLLVIKLSMSNLQEVCVRGRFGKQLHCSAAKDQD